MTRKAGDDILSAMHTKERIPHAHVFDGTGTCVCGKQKDLVKARRARTNRQRGKAAEREAADLFGGEVVGGLGGPDDVRGREWLSQVKSHQAAPPGYLSSPRAIVVQVPTSVRYAWVWTEFPRTGHTIVAPARWADIFENMAERPNAHRLLERYARRGHKAAWYVVRERIASQDLTGAMRTHYIVMSGEDWLANFGRDE